MLDERPHARSSPARASIGRVALARPHPARLLQRPGEDGRDLRRGRRASAGCSPATWPPSRTTAPSTLLGRGSQCINTGGEKVFPEEVEAVLKAHPAVYDALVVGVADERWGSGSPRSCSPPTAPTPTLDELRAHCRANLAGYKVPKHLVFVDQVRRSPAGKADYRWAEQTATIRNWRAMRERIALVDVPISICGTGVKRDRHRLVAADEVGGAVDGLGRRRRARGRAGGSSSRSNITLQLEPGRGCCRGRSGCRSRRPRGRWGARSMSKRNGSSNTSSSRLADG